MSRTKSRLTRQKIAATALAIADREGFEAVSMRRVAQELKVGTMSLYYYVKTKDDLLAVIRSVHAGRRHVPAEVAARLAEHLGEDDLTVRELEVLRLIRDGYRNKQIADQLAIAETTVNFHVKNLVAKLEAKDRTHAVTIALRRGLLQMQG